jgi:putative hemin transport protein
MTIEHTDDSTLSHRYAALRGADPSLRVRDAAARLAVSEEALVALDCGAHTTRLRCEPRAILQAIREWKLATALTRNGAVVSEVTGRYSAVEGGEHVAQVVGDPIDLRLFFSHWRSAYAVRGTARGRPLLSVQFFDRHGEAIHKAYAKGEGDDARFDALVAAFASDDQRQAVQNEPVALRGADNTDVDREAFAQAWSAMTNTHEFFSLLRRFDVSRPRALALVEGRYAWRLAPDVLAPLLDAAAASALPLMFFVANRGCIQIHSGAIERVRPMEGWLNVLDPAFNLHVQQRSIVAAWRVEKPTSDGVITSVELYDAQGESVLLVFGLRKDQGPERADWRALVGSLTPSA